MAFMVYNRACHIMLYRSRSLLSTYCATGNAMVFCRGAKSTAYGTATEPRSPHNFLDSSTEEINENYFSSSYTSDGKHYEDPMIPERYKPREKVEKEISKVDLTPLSKTLQEMNSSEIRESIDKNIDSLSPEEFEQFRAISDRDDITTEKMQAYNREQEWGREVKPKRMSRITHDYDLPDRMFVNKDSKRVVTRWRQDSEKRKALSGVMGKSYIFTLGGNSSHISRREESMGKRMRQMSDELKKKLLSLVHLGGGGTQGLRQSQVDFVNCQYSRDFAYVRVFWDNPVGIVDDEVVATILENNKDVMCNELWELTKTKHRPNIKFIRDFANDRRRHVNQLIRERLKDEPAIYAWITIRTAFADGWLRLNRYMATPAAVIHNEEDDGNFIHEVIVIGDGFSEGFGDWVVWRHVAGISSYLMYLCQQSKTVRQRWRFINKGCRGVESSAWLPTGALWQWAFNDERKHKRAVMVMVGYEDGLEDVLKDDTPDIKSIAKKTVENIACICDAITTQLCIPVYVGGIPNTRIDGGLLKELTEEKNHQLRLWLNAEALKYKEHNDDNKEGPIRAGAMLDTCTAFKADRNVGKLHCFDGRHLNSKGYRLLADTWFEILSPAFTKLEWGIFKRILVKDKKA